MNRAACSSGGGGGRGGHNGNGRPPHQHNLPDLVGRYDRFCGFCAFLLVDAALEKPASCKHCEHAIALHYSSVLRDREGFFRCQRCWAVMCPGHMVCEICGRKRQTTDHPARETTPPRDDELVRALDEAEASHRASAKKPRKDPPADGV